MKKTVLLILMVSSLFADKVVYKVYKNRSEVGNLSELVQKFNKEVEGEYLGVLDGKTYIRTNNEKLKAINCSDVIVVIDNDEKPIQFDCSENTFTPKILTELDVKEIKKGYVGGFLIAVGGVFLLNNIEKDLEDYDSFEDFEDSIKASARMGYGFIIIGGILVGFGI